MTSDRAAAYPGILDELIPRGMPVSSTWDRIVDRGQAWSVEMATSTPRSWLPSISITCGYTMVSTSRSWALVSV